MVALPSSLWRPSPKPALPAAAGPRTHPAVGLAPAGMRERLPMPLLHDAAAPHASDMSTYSSLDDNVFLLCGQPKVIAKCDRLRCNVQRSRQQVTWPASVAWHADRCQHSSQCTPAWPEEGVAQVADQAEHAASGVSALAHVAVVAGQAGDAAFDAAAVAGVLALAALHQACCVLEVLVAAWVGLAAPCR